MVRQHDALLASLVLQVSYWSVFILSNIWSLPDLSLPLPVTLPRTVSLHIRGRGRQVGAERCTKRKMKFPGHTMGWGAWWTRRRECLWFISSSKANSLKKGWITPSCQSCFGLPLEQAKTLCLFLTSEESGRKSHATQPPLAHPSPPTPDHILPSSVNRNYSTSVYNKIISFALLSVVHKTSWCISSWDDKRF